MNATTKTEFEIMTDQLAEINKIKASEANWNRSGFSINAEKLRGKRLDQKYSRLNAAEKAELRVWDNPRDLNYGPVGYFWEFELGLSWEECKAKYEASKS